MVIYGRKRKPVATRSKAGLLSQINKIYSQKETKRKVPVVYVIDYEFVEKWHSVSNLYINHYL
jgi:hypothetical protein